MKKARGARVPREHSAKLCCCGGHNSTNVKRNRHHHSTQRRRWYREGRRLRQWQRTQPYAVREPLITTPVEDAEGRPCWGSAANVEAGGAGEED